MYNNNYAYSDIMIILNVKMGRLLLQAGGWENKTYRVICNLYPYATMNHTQNDSEGSSVKHENNIETN